MASDTPPRHDNAGGLTPSVGPASSPLRSPAASKAEQMARHAHDDEIAPHEKQALAAQTSREEDA